MAEPIRQAVVLAGGKGTRLGALTAETPKPLLPVAGRPFLDIVLAFLARHGIDQVLLSIGHLADAFTAFLAGRSWRDPYGEAIAVSEIREPAPAGTAGALVGLADRLDQRFLLVNADTFFDCNLAAVLAAGEAAPAGTALLTVRLAPDAGRYGSIVAAGGRVLSFNEKGTAGPGLINAGLSVLDRSVAARVAHIPSSIEADIYPRLAAEGTLFAVEEDGYFIDIGLPETYSRAQTELPQHLRKPAVFFDRDGVLNEDGGYIHRVEDFAWKPGAVEAIRAVRAAGYLAVVVSNQAGVAHGYYGEAAVHVFHRHMNRLLRAEGTQIDAFYYAPYHPDGSVPGYAVRHEDRKPGAGMLMRAARDLDIDMSRSLLVGDRDSDLGAAANAGIPGYLYAGGSLRDAVAPLLAGAMT